MSEAGDSKKLNPKQEIFVREYLISKNAAEAYRKAYGAKNRVAEVSGHKLLRKANIKAEIEKHLNKAYEKLDVDALRILKEIFMMSTANLADAYNDDGSLKNIRDMPEQIQRMISGIETIEVYEGSGSDRVYVGDLKKIKTYDKNKSLDMAARHFKLLVNIVEHTGTVNLADKMANARKRKNH